MGTWGPGNLENDSALCELSDRSHKLVKTMMARAKRKRSRRYDEYDYTTLFVELEIIFALESKGLLSGVLPEPDDVESLKTGFINDWESYFLNLVPDANLDARRKCITRTFNKFKRICAKHKADGWPG